MKSAGCPSRQSTAARKYRCSPLVRDRGSGTSSAGRRKSGATAAEILVWFGFVSRYLRVYAVCLSTQARTSLLEESSSQRYGSGTGLPNRTSAVASRRVVPWGGSGRAAFAGADAGAAAVAAAEGRAAAPRAVIGGEAPQATRRRGSAAS